MYVQSQLVGLFETKLHLKQQPEEALLQAVEFPLEDKNDIGVSSVDSLNRTERFPEKLSFTLCKVHHHERERNDWNTDTQKFFCASQFFFGG